MSFIGKSIRKNFPEWSTTYKDDSSVGGRFFDSIGKSLESTREGIMRFNSQSPTLEYKPVYEPGNIQYINLNEDNDWGIFLNENKNYLGSELFGKLNQEEILLIQTESYEDYCLAIPQRISLENEKLVTSSFFSTRENYSNESFFFEKEPKEIYFDLTDIEYFDNSRTRKDFQESYYVMLRGKDILGRYIEEKIDIVNIGLYKSKNKFSTLEPLIKDIEKNINGGPSIEIEGLKGEVVFYHYPINILGKEIKNKIVVSPKKSGELLPGEGSENNLFLELRVENGKSYLDYIYRYYIEGFQYRASDQLEEQEAFEEILFSKVMKSLSNEDILIEDFCWDEVLEKIVTIDNLGIIRYYSLDKRIFLESEIKRTKEINFIFESDSQQVAENETSNLYLFLERAKGNIEEVFVFRKRPNEELFEFLNDSNEWVYELSSFKGWEKLDSYENFNSKKIPILYESTGQHNYFVASFREDTETKLLEKIKNNESSVEEFIKYINNYKEGIYKDILYVNKYSVMCESGDLKKEIDSGLGEGSYGILKKGLENKLHIIKKESDLEYCYIYKEHKDVYLLNYNNGEIALSDKYDEVSISINDSYLKDVTYD